MKIVTPAPRRERTFPNPIDINARRAGQDEQDKDEEEALQSLNYRRRQVRLSIKRDAGCEPVIVDNLPARKKFAHGHPGFRANRTAA
jgi:hypothetical protein